MTTTAGNNFTRYYASLSVGSLQVGRPTVQTSFSLPIRIGNNAGTALPVGTLSLVIGDYSAPKITAESNTVVGELCLKYSTTGIYNTVFGWQAANNLVTGGGNTIVGALASTNSDSDYGTAVGYAAYANTTGTTVGAVAFGGYSAAVGNTNIGAYSGTLTMAGYNTAVGSYSGRGGSAQFASICAFGFQALGVGVKTTAADGSCAFGRGSLAAVTSGAHNSAFGFGSGGVLTTGGYNALFGFNAGVLLTGSYNTIMGADPAAVGAISGSVALGKGVTATDNTFSVAVNNATTYISTDLVLVNNGSTSNPANVDYFKVYFNGVEKRILLYDP